MNNKMYVFLCAMVLCLIAVILSGCTDRRSGIAGNDSGKSEGQSVAKDSAEAFVSDDLSTFWLHGRVREVVETTESGYSVTIRFDRDGNLISHSAYNGKNFKILRDTDNRIISMVNIGGGESGNSGQDYTYDADGNVCDLSHWAESHDTYQFVSFNKLGWPLKGNIADCDDDYSGKVHYKYPHVDAAGNWTEQVAYESWPDIEETPYVTKRKIEYYGLK